ncbi:hypothetical protein Patl1_15178 [Pistacia atlantica]|uniref:Uncharacterized protein n=1 Tax=Pistacia atlantica TaxID=434234 RepID=A0ACC1B8C3_9ROSI|nr:hypothetical protein Patl1_15178 [Pistacia atlantica]
MDMNDTTCPIQSLLSLNLTNSRFSLEYDRLYQMYALLNCTVKITWTDSVLGPFDCISDERKFIYATDDQTYEYVWMPPVCSWYKTVNISIDYMYRDNQTEKIVIVWEALDGCWDCEKSGNYCGFNTTSNSTSCIKNKHYHGHGGVVNIAVPTATSIGGIVFFALEIAKKLAIVGLWCIQWNPTERPSMPLVLQMLEGDLQSLEIPPKPFASSDDEMDAN